MNHDYIIALNVVKNIQLFHYYLDDVEVVFYEDVPMKVEGSGEPPTLDGSCGFITLCFSK